MNASVPYSRWAQLLVDHDSPLAGQKSFFWHSSAWQEQWKAINGDDIEYAREFFGQTRTLLADHSALQVAAAMWYLIDPHTCEIPADLSDGVISSANSTRNTRSVSLEQQRACIEAMVYPFTDMFRHYCGDRLVRDSRGVGDTPVHSLCFMWWDVIFHGTTLSATGLVPSILDVLTTLCSDPSLACVESAFHGLGHFHQYAPSVVRDVVDRTLCERALPPQLQEYGETAAFGEVL